jgi:hypothetical protein
MYVLDHIVLYLRVNSECASGHTHLRHDSECIESVCVNVYVYHSMRKKTHIKPPENLLSGRPTADFTYKASRKSHQEVL